MGVVSGNKETDTLFGIRTWLKMAVSIGKILFQNLFGRSMSDLPGVVSTVFAETYGSGDSCIPRFSEMLDWNLTQS